MDRLDPERSVCLGEIPRRGCPGRALQVDTKRFVEDAQAEFLGVQRDLENTFFAKLRPALDAVAKERGFLFVFNEDAGLLAWVNPALDVTADVVKRLNQP